MKSTMSPSPRDIVAALRHTLGNGSDFVALHEPRFTGREQDYLAECLNTGWVSSVGAFVDRFEADTAAVCGVRHAVAVVNGTAALHVALMVAGVMPGDEVIVPALSFVATANAVSHCGAIPHFADSEERTLGLSPTALRRHLAAIADMNDGRCRNGHSGQRIAAILPMHTFGHPVDMDGIRAVADEYGLVVIEDAAEALGSRYKGRPCGSLGRLGALSFNGNKIVTTGGGGMVVTDDADLARKVKHLTTTAKIPHRWAFNHDQVGYNYRLPNINAALGCAQLERLPDFVSAKRRLAQAYRTAFAGMAGIRFVVEPDFTESNYWLCSLLLDEDAADLRDDILALTNDQGIMTRPAWGLMHHQPMYAECPRMPLPVAESLARRLINIPSSPFLDRSNAA